ncbi:hypothetical protein BX666DRAFT_1835441, partial [Dichotomocladium elegans]
PGLLKDPLVRLIGDRCYESLIEDFDLTHLDCIKYALSKVLGLGIVVGGSVVKIPQIFTIVSSGSVRGLSLASFVLETLACCITFSYNWRQSNPFSTYGESFFLMIQNILISLMVLFYNRRYGATAGGLIAYLLFLSFLTSATLVPSWLMASLYAITIPLSLASKVPQIYTNYVNRSTGQLSVFAVFNYFFGTTARVFTTVMELDDPLMLFGNLLASILNGVLVVQVFIYW